MWKLKVKTKSTESTDKFLIWKAEKWMSFSPQTRSTAPPCQTTTGRRSSTSRRGSTNQMWSITFPVTRWRRRATCSPGEPDVSTWLITQEWAAGSGFLSADLTLLLCLFQPLADHSHSHVLSAGDRLQEGLRLHPVQTSTQLRGEDHVQEEAPGADHVQVRHQQLGRSGDLSRGEVNAERWMTSQSVHWAKH